MRYVIIGAGPAGIIAAETLRKTDRDSRITLIGDEYHAPYSRMAIPYYLADQIPEEGMLLRKERNHFADLQIDYVQKPVTRLHPQEKSVGFEDGSTLPYDRLLIASGSRPVTPPIQGLEGPGVHTCWTVQDAREIHKLSPVGAHVVLIGAGFIGSIILNALHSRKVKLTVVEMENRMVPRMMNEAAGTLLKRWCEKQGVAVLTSTKVTAVDKGVNRRFRLSMETGRPVEADLIIVATGVVPRIDFLQGSGVATGQGILVDAHLKTSAADIYAAGDAAEGVDFSSGLQAVHPIQPTASEHGRVAALNMAGVPAAYPGSLNMNVLDTIGLVSYSFGQWMGVPGDDHAERMDEERFRYTRLEFQGDRLVGGIVVGEFEGIGIVRGLIQSKIHLREWKERLMRDPMRVAEAYLGRTKMAHVPRLARRAG